MSELRTKIAAGATILALGGLAGVALTHPQPPVGHAQVKVASKHSGKQYATPAIYSRDDAFEAERADD
jgi:hypothetical protein